MDIKYLQTEENLRQDLINFCKKNLPQSKAEVDMGTRFEHTDKFIHFIVEQAFKKCENIQEFPSIMQNMIGDRKHNLVVNCSRAIDIMMEGRLAEHPLVLDFDEKRGTLLKYNNRTISKHLESDLVNQNISNIRNNTLSVGKKLKHD
jgi:hypothetical protein